MVSVELTNCDTILRLQYLLILVASYIHQWNELYNHSMCIYIIPPSTSFLFLLSSSFLFFLFFFFLPFSPFFFFFFSPLPSYLFFFLLLLFIIIFRLPFLLLSFSSFLPIRSELQSLIRGVGGEFVLPAPGGDVIRDGAGVLPTGQCVVVLCCVLLCVVVLCCVLCCVVLRCDVV